MNDLTQTNHQDKTLRVLDILAEHPSLSQREIAQHAGISLGLVNLIIKRLVCTGYIKASNFTACKAEYMVTPKGLQEKSIRTYSYLLKTIKTFRKIHQQIKALVQRLTQEGHRFFALRGHSELTDLIVLSIRDLGQQDIHYRYLQNEESPGPGEFVLDCRMDGIPGSYGVSVLENLLGLTDGNENMAEKGLAPALKN